MNKIAISIISTISILMILSIITLPVSAEVLEVRGRIANETLDKTYIDLSTGIARWNVINFPGLFYDLDYDLGNERLTLQQVGLTGSSRIINKGSLMYITNGDNKLLNVVAFGFGGNFSKAKANGLKGFEAGNMSTQNGKYEVVGWQANKYVALKNKTNKLTNLVIEQNKVEAKLMTDGNTWNIGKGWKLKVLTVDANTNPKRVRIQLFKNNVNKDDKIVNEGKIYTYIQNKVENETNVPVFLTYVSNITHTTVDIARFKYTWVIDTNVTAIKTGDKFGVFKTTIADATQIVLRNMDTTVTLERGSLKPLMGNMGIRVMDSQFLRIYPEVSYNIIR